MRGHVSGAVGSTHRHSQGDPALARVASHRRPNEGRPGALPRFQVSPCGHLSNGDIHYYSCKLSLCFAKSHCNANFPAAFPRVSFLNRHEAAYDAPLPSPDLSIRRGAYMETSVEGRPAVRDYFTHRARPAHVRAACMLVAAVALATSAAWLDPMRARYYETAAGQYQTINCSNSSITLSAQSRIAVQCTRGLVRVRLLRGEASFRTTQDPSRSTLVLAGDAQVHDFGSRFSVRRSADRTTVTVVEGFVELSVLY